MSEFTFEQVGKSFPGPDGRRVEALREFSLTGRMGEFLVLLGASGSGKTTALRVLAGLETVDHGHLTLEGKPAEKIPARDRDAAMVFQHPALYPHLTVEANLRLGLEIRRVRADEIRRRVGEAVELLGLGDLARRKPSTLSGGQMQRVALARAVVRRPRLLLLDEPLANLDGPARSELKERIRELQTLMGITTVLVTHDQAEAFSLGQRVAVVEAGRVLQADVPMTLYLRPETLALAQFLARPRLNLLPGTISADAGGLWFDVKNADGGPGPRLKLPKISAQDLAPWRDKPLLLAFRPEQAGFLSERQTAVQGAIELEARVARIELLGGWVDSHLDLAGHRLVVRTTCGRTPEGSTARIAAAFDTALFFDPASATRVAPI
jgi:multiple sugar transport system ATP-binding protein